MKLTKTSKTIIRKTWKAWATYTRFCWETVMDIPANTRSYFELTEIFAADKACAGALSEWYALSQLAEELGINWMDNHEIDEETSTAFNDHDLYNDLIWKHAAR